MKMQMLTSWLAVVGVISVLPGYAQAAGSAGKGDVASAIEAMENKWEANVGKKEEGAKAVGATVSEDFVGVSFKGKRMTKASLLADYRKDPDSYTSTKNANLKVYVMSPNTAVTVGDAVEKGKGKDGQSFDRTYRFTDTWLERNGKWQCVASQISLVRGGAPKGLTGGSAPVGPAFSTFPGRGPKKWTQALSSRTPRGQPRYSLYIYRKEVAGRTSFAEKAM